MFRYASRGFPLRLFVLMVAGFLLVNAVGGLIAAGIGVVFFLPLLLFKAFLILMLLRFVVGFVGGRLSSGRPGPWARRATRRAEEDADKAEFNEFVRQARQRLDDLFPQP